MIVCTFFPGPAFSLGLPSYVKLSLVDLRMRHWQNRADTGKNECAHSHSECARQSGVPDAVSASAISSCKAWPRLAPSGTNTANR